MAAERFLDALAADEVESADKRWLRDLILVAFMMCVLAAAWHWTPLKAWLDLDTIIAAGEHLRDNPLTPLIVIGAYLIAGLTLFPINLLVVATAFSFGPLKGLLYSLAGSLASALLLFGLGRLMGREAVRRLAGPRVNRLSRRLARHGTIAVIAVRIIPIAPFSLVNAVAGASHLRFHHFILGSVLGLTPGIAAISFFEHRLEVAIRNPGVTSFAILAILTTAVGVGAILVGRWLRGRTRSSQAGSSSEEGS